MKNKKLRRREEHVDPRMERKRKRLKTRRNRALVIIVELLILLLLSGAAYALNQYSKFQTVNIETSEIYVNEGAKKEGYTTVALFGGDSRDGVLEQGTHADAIIIASINNETLEVNLASVYRDTYTEQTDGTMKKVNNAYYVGGPEDAINVLNMNFDLDIEEYVTVDFAALTNTIDLLGGIDITIDEEEMNEMNEYINETAEVAGVEAVLITKTGTQTVDGAQAVTYARIRKTTGGDFKRTERQRIVIEQTMEKALSTNMTTINSIINTVFPQVSTSFTLSEIVDLATNGTAYDIVETVGFPFDVENLVLDDVGSVEVPVGLTTNVIALHEALYPDEESYSLSTKIQEIDERIVLETGIDEESEIE